MTRRPRPPYDKQLLAGVREQLAAMVRKLRGEADALAEEVLQPSGQDSGFENPADFGSDTFTEELQVDLLEDRAALLAECQQALDRLDGLGDYDYGLCRPCREQPRRLCPTCPWIPSERLSYLPCARLCMPMQQAAEAELEREQGEALP